MRDQLEHMKYEAGYPGEDSMRAKAERLMKEELMKTPMHLPASHSTPSHEKMRLYKKGGHVKKHKETEMGGHLTNLHLPRKEKLSVQSVKEAQALRKGGAVHHKKHHRMHKAAGGTVYERHMLGEHPSHKRPHINYEHEMMGEHCMRSADGGRHAKGYPSGPSNPHAFDASMGEYKKCGGRVKKHHTKKMAAGGAAKIRHGVATPSGRPIMKKSPKGY